MSPCLACLLTLNDMVIYFPGRENVSQEFKSVFEGKRFGSLVDVGGGGGGGGGGEWKLIIMMAKGEESELVVAV